MEIRKLHKPEYEAALALVWEVFLEYEAPEYSKEGVGEFLGSIHDAAYVSMLSMYGAFTENELMGMIASRAGGSHIALFFVKGEYQGQGIGRQLFEAVKADCKDKCITVNSSPFAVEIYKNLGFCAVDKEQVVNGLRFTPMEYVMV